MLKVKNWWRYGLVALVALVLMLSIAPSQPVAAQDDGQTTYVVQPGDNLYRISLRFNTTVGAIVAANNIPNPNLVFVGQVLIIPSGSTVPAPPPAQPVPPPQQPAPQPAPGGTYVVQRGDNLSRIAQRFGTTLSAILAINAIPNPSLIYVGQVINLPSGGTTPPPAPAPPPGQPAPPPPGPAPSGFALGGHIIGYGQVAAMRSAGMTWVKVQIRWNRGEGTGGAANIIQEARNNGFNILLSIVGIPSQMGDYERYTDEYAAYVGAVAALGPNAIEVWNEPNLTHEWPAGAISGTSYTTLLRKAYTAIKAVNPSVLVISAGPAPTGFFGGCGGNGCDDLPFLQQMRAAGATNYMDCIGAHYNEGIISPTQRTGDPRNPFYTRYFFGMLDTYYNAFGGQRPVCWTELGFLTPEGYGPLPGAFGWAANTTVAQHAQWLGEAASLSRSSGRVPLMIVWNVDFTQYGDDPQAGYAIVRPGGSCPACAPLAAAVR